LQAKLRQKKISRKKSPENAKSLTIKRVLVDFSKFCAKMVKIGNDWKHIGCFPKIWAFC